MKCIKKVLGDQTTTIRVDESTASSLVKTMDWSYCPKKKGATNGNFSPAWIQDPVKTQKIIKEELAKLEAAYKGARKDEASA